MKENQKAFDLVQKMVLSSECWKSGSIEPAKECAIVAVETILNFQEHFKCPDLMVFVPCGGYAGLFLELKKETPFKLNGEIKASPKDHLRKQQEALQRLNALGYNASFQWDFDTIVKLIDDYFKNYHFFPLPNEKE